MLALVSSRIFCIRQPSFPITFPICFDGTTILNITSCPLARFAADNSTDEAIPRSSSSRRRFMDEGYPASWVEYGTWSGMWYGMCICCMTMLGWCIGMDIDMCICCCCCCCMWMGWCRGIWFCWGTMLGFIGNWPCCDIVGFVLEKCICRSIKYRVLLLPNYQQALYYLRSFLILFYFINEYQQSQIYQENGTSIFT